MTDEFSQLPFEGDPSTGFDLVDFADNPEPRAACVLLVDVSESMQGEPIASLNQGLQQFATELRGDRLASKRVEIAVVKFGGTVDVVAEFGSAQAFYPQPLTAKGGTPMGEAIEVGLDLLAARQQQYREAGITPYRPWMFMITDGAPTDSVERAARRVAEGERRRAFSFFAVGVDGAHTATLACISVNAPVKLRGLAFADMFRWLSTSLSAVSRSCVGQPVHPSNPAGPAGWATIV